MATISTNWEQRDTGATNLPQEPGNKVSEHDGLVGLAIAWRRRNPCSGPQVTLPLIQKAIGGAGVEQEDSGRAVYEPAAIQGDNAPVIHGLDSGAQGRVFGFDFFDLDGGLGASQRGWRKVMRTVTRTELRFKGPSMV